MPTHNDIRYLSRQEIDEHEWNACLQRSPNGLVYAQTKFLDILCPGWGALVLGNYQAIMPLPQRKKWGIAYLFQPFQLPVLGVFGDVAATSNTDAFLQAIPAQFRLWDMSLNTANHTHQYAPYAIARQNFILPLHADHALLEQQYSTQLKRSLKRAARAKMVVHDQLPFQAVLALAKENYPVFTKAEPADFESIATICQQMHQQVSAYGVFDQSQVLLASAIFLHYRNRAYYWMVGNDSRGRQHGASALLLDSFIRRHAGTGIVLDFEGSEVPGVAAFYRSFGAINEPYTTIYYNKLPYPFHLLKKMPAHYRQIKSTIKRSKQY